VIWEKRSISRNGQARGRHGLCIVLKSNKSQDDGNSNCDAVLLRKDFSSNGKKEQDKVQIEENNRYNRKPYCQGIIKPWKLRVDIEV
jgi:hypothetical protein